jgi:hypothetical protein
MRAWRNLKQGDYVTFSAEHGGFHSICIVTNVSETRAIARTPSGLDFWIDDETRHLFKLKEAGNESEGISETA